MVEQSDLPFRLLTRRYGAQLCYSAMVIANVFVKNPSTYAKEIESCPEDRPFFIQV